MVRRLAKWKRYVAGGLAAFSWEFGRWCWKRERELGWALRLGLGRGVGEERARRRYR